MAEFSLPKPRGRTSDLHRGAGLEFSGGVQECANVDISSQAGPEVARCAQMH